VDRIHALYEAEVYTSEDQTAILFGSRHFQVRDWLQTGRENRKHSYVITLNLAAPGSKKEDDNIQSTAILDLGARELDTIYTPNMLPSSSGWMGGGLGLTDTDKSRVKDLASSRRLRRFNYIRHDLRDHRGDGRGQQVRGDARDLFGCGKAMRQRPSPPR